MQVLWAAEGAVTQVRGKRTFAIYPAVSMHENAGGFSLFTSAAHTEPIMQIQTKSGDLVCMTSAELGASEKSMKRNLSLLEKIKTIAISEKTVCYDYNGVIFPMVDLDQEVDISWLKGMLVTPDFYIAQALQQTKFKMNEKGAHVKSAVALGLECTACPEKSMRLPLVIDTPFYLWIERPGVTDPIFAAYVTEENWKDPKSLEL
jgi:hypothetical protein